MRTILRTTKQILQTGLEGSRRLADQGLAKVFPPTLVLTYHRVCELDFDPHQICVHPENFAAHLKILKERSLVSRWEEFGDFSRPRVFISFDDGYRDNLEIAAPLLREAGAEGLFFIASRGAGDAPLFWWDELALRILHPEVSRPESLELEISGEKRSFRLGNSDARGAASNELHRFLKRNCTVDTRTRILTEIRMKTGPIPEKLLDSHAVMNRDELIKLANAPGCKIGAHTLNHPCLRVLDIAAQKTEIVESRMELEKILGKTVDLFSYPFGSYLDFNGTSKRIAKDSRFRFTFANIPGTVKPGFDREAIPRFTVRNWSEDEFRKAFRGYLSDL